MYIHDVIASLRERDLKLARELRSVMLLISTMERYLSEVSNYPAPPVSRETTSVLKGDNEDGDPTLF